MGAPYVQTNPLGDAPNMETWTIHTGGICRHVQSTERGESWTNEDCDDHSEELEERKMQKMPSAQYFEC